MAGTSKSMSRQSASRAAVLSQVAAVGLLAATVGVVMLWRPVAPASEGQVTESSWEAAQQRARAKHEANLAKAAAGQAEAAPLSDAETIASMLEQAGHIRKPEPETQVADAPAPSGATETAAPTRSGGQGLSAFLGAVRVGDERWGLFRVGSSQGLMRVGAVRGFRPHGEPGEDPVQVEVVSIEDDHAVVKEAGAQRRLDKAARAAEVISVAAEATRAEPKPDKTAVARSASTEFGGGLTVPRVEDFRAPDGKLDRAGFTAAMRDYQELRAAGAAAGEEAKGAATDEAGRRIGGGGGGTNRRRP